MSIKNIRTWVVVTIGSVLIAFSSVFFFVPFDIVSGGTAGIAIILFGLFSIPIDVTVFVLVWGLLIVGYFLLGKRFTINTLLASIVYPVAVFIFFRFFPSNFIGFDVEEETHKLLAALFGGAIAGLGVGMTFLVGGSTGGVDVIILSLKKYFDVKSSIGALLVDSSIILSGILFVGVLNGLYGIIAAIASAVLIEFIFLGFSSSYQATIISKQSKEINTYILNTMNRGSTLIKVTGSFTNNEMQMIQVAFDRKELSKLRNKIAEIDPKAFAIFTKIQSINGEGFSPFKEEE
jgi:uncharacterized membrane-anchored protein YitT (DUF2179 family)